MLCTPCIPWSPSPQVSPAGSDYAESMEEYGGELPGDSALQGGQFPMLEFAKKHFREVQRMKT